MMKRFSCILFLLMVFASFEEAHARKWYERWASKAYNATVAPAVDGIVYVAEGAADGIDFVATKVTDGAVWVSGKVVDGLTWTAEKIEDGATWAYYKYKDIKVAVNKGTKFFFMWASGLANPYGSMAFLNYINGIKPTAYEGSIDKVIDVVLDEGSGTDSWDDESTVYNPSELQGSINPALVYPQIAGEVSFAVGRVNYKATVTILPGDGDGNPLNRPLVIGDAFDPLSARNVTTILNNPKQENLLRNFMHGDAGYSTPRELGYDIVFVNFYQGGGDIKKNAKLFMKVLQEVERLSTSKYVVGGISMGGVISRMALLYSLPQNNTQYTKLLYRVKGYLSIDAPQQGASIGHFQHAMFSTMLDEEVVSGCFADGKTNPLYSKYAQLNVPAAWQMLYGHHYFSEDAVKTSPVQNNFYKKLFDMGDYRSDIPMVAIAYSNFYQPHPGINTSQETAVGKIRVTAGGKVIAKREFNAGGAGTEYGKHELAPGSIGDWYYDAYNPGGGANEHLVLYSKNGETFKGTFIPIYSALDLRDFDMAANPNPTESELAAYSPFDRVFYMHQAQNGYRNDQTIEGKRYEHGVFDPQIMAAIEQSLRFLEARDPEKVMAAVYQLLGPRRVLANASATNQISYFNTNMPYWYNITMFPSWHPKTITIQIQPTDGQTLSGYAVVEGVSYPLSGYYTDIRIAYVGQPNITAKITAEAGRQYRAEWWADMSTPPNPTYYLTSLFGEDNSQPPVQSGIAVNSVNTYTAFTVNPTQAVLLSNFPSWGPQAIVLQVQPDDGRSMEGSVTVNGSTYNLAGWNQDIRIPYTNQGSIQAVFSSPTPRNLKIQWWAQ